MNVAYSKCAPTLKWKNNFKNVNARRLTEIQLNILVYNLQYTELTAYPSPHKVLVHM